MCGTYIFTAGVLQSSRQDLGCSSPQCLPLPLGTEHVELPFLLLCQSVAITHLVIKKKKIVDKKRERTERTEVNLQIKKGSRLRGESDVALKTTRLYC